MIISIIFFTVLGFSQTSGSYDAGNLNEYISYLEGSFHIGWATLIPAVLIIALLMFRVGAFEALGIGAVAGALVAIFVQGADLKSVLSIAYNGFKCDTDIGVLKSILNRGGMSSMLQYVAIITFAVGMGGMLNKLGVLNNILSVFTKHIHSDGALIFATIMVGYVTSIVKLFQPNVPCVDRNFDEAAV